MGPWGGDINGMSQPTVSLFCKQGALALVPQRAQWIKMPQHDTISLRDFIQYVDLDKEARNDCRKEMDLQVVTNATLEIMDIVAHWRGSTHDSRIFNERSLKQRFE
ncbi:Uncharacterized protein OBRU01_09070 [Operophtera brumata]|uniref:DDE Tnp4 domain-containing protein n=1 Tax=Operophtera brumata TaxID=104452 RepID=A0A0L7LB12_OPEBR|nr:Uncharacterized protein OBRU01_09070 [Operophtera brumata]